MEKLTVEIEVAKDIMEAFNQFVERSCFDKELYLKKILLTGILRGAHGGRIRGIYESYQQRMETAQQQAQ